MTAGGAAADRETDAAVEGGAAQRGAAPVFQASLRLRPGVSSGAAVARLGFGAWHDWRTAWDEAAAELGPPAGPEASVVSARVSVEGVTEDAPVELRVAGVDAALALIRYLGATGPEVDVERARRIARALCRARANLTPANLRAVMRLPDAEIEVLLAVAGWLAEHQDLSAWTLRQLPIPRAHSKWVETHGGLLRDVVGRDVGREVRPRLAVVHLTYVDPGYLRGRGRRHDAWTTGDVHDLAYVPQRVLVVENRDCRLWFPEAEGTVVVEGGGKAAASLLAGIPWIRSAGDVVYWGDIDADGFAILDRFRGAMAGPDADGVPGPPVRSILMDGVALGRYEQLGVDRDASGRPIKPSSARLTHLTEGETVAYHAVATAGEAPVRRIEQERIPEQDALAALMAADHH
ncbi:hypothetical protein HGK34_17910 [Myceligenerans sp. I2]|uniref:DUF3322 and DUF2220 domain-containing protein n=1 Tax=Myceligenerans indicum TaxID=2593663 RepID=A0ABS1LRJ4_9MICO|nr:hypothetical protein [Myceligenerans indicum]